MVYILQDERAMHDAQWDVHRVDKRLYVMTYHMQVVIGQNTHEKGKSDGFIQLVDR